MEFKAGQKWKCRNGLSVRITNIIGEPYPIYGDILTSEGTVLLKESWTDQGRIYIRDEIHPNDLIELIGDPDSTSWATINYSPSPTQATRDNKGKVDLTYLPREALEQEARVWEFGATKYGRDNWTKLWGDDTIRVCMASAMRHMLAINSGELLDPESGLPHASHIRCNMAMILEYMKEK